MPMHVNELNKQSTDEALTNPYNEIMDERSINEMALVTCTTAALSRKAMVININWIMYTIKKAKLNIERKVELF